MDELRAAFKELPPSKPALAGAPPFGPGVAAKPGGLIGRQGAWRGSAAVLLVERRGRTRRVQTAAVPCPVFVSWKKDRGFGGAQRRSVAGLHAGTYTGSRERYDEFLALSRAASTDQEKLRFLRALGEFRVPGMLFAAAIDLVVKEVKADDAPYILGATWVSRAPVLPRGKPYAATGTRSPGVCSSGTVRMIAGCSALDTPELAAEVEQFFARTKVAQGEMAVAQMLERLSVNARLRRIEGPRLAGYLARRR